MAVCEGVFADMIKRIVTAVVGVFVLIVILALPEAVFHIAACLVTAGILYEILRAMRASALLGCISVISAVLAIFGFMTWFVALFMSVIMLLYHKYGLYGILPVFVCAWGTDTCAYFAGCFLGKHKLIERVSPKKTIEGAIGGAVGSTLLCLLYAWILMLIEPVAISGVRFYLLFAVMGLISSVLAQLGDLAASALKRDCGIKDFGTVFPGHGGILDRFDSVIFIAPFVYFIVYVLSLTH